MVKNDLFKQFIRKKFNCFSEFSWSENVTLFTGLYNWKVKLLSQNSYIWFQVDISYHGVYSAQTPWLLWGDAGLKYYWTELNIGGGGGLTVEVKKNVSKERSRNTPLLLFILTKLLKCEFTPFHFQTFNFTQLTLFIFYFNLIEQLITFLVPQHFPDWFLWHPGVPSPTFWEGTKFLDKNFFLNYLIH